MLLPFVSYRHSLLPVSLYFAKFKLDCFLLFTLIMLSSPRCKHSDPISVPFIYYLLLILLDFTLFLSHPTLFTIPVLISILSYHLSYFSCNLSGLGVLLRSCPLPWITSCLFRYWYFVPTAIVLILADGSPSALQQSLFNSLSFPTP